MTVLSKKTVSSSVTLCTWKRRMMSEKPCTTRRPLTWCLLQERDVDDMCCRFQVHAQP